MNGAAVMSEVGGKLGEGVINGFNDELTGRLSGCRDEETLGRLSGCRPEETLGKLSNALVGRLGGCVAGERLDKLSNELGGSTIPVPTEPTPGVTSDGLLNALGNGTTGELLGRLITGLTGPTIAVLTDGTFGKAVDVSKGKATGVTTGGRSNCRLSSGSTSGGPTLFASVGVGSTSTYPYAVEKVKSWSQAVTVYRETRSLSVVAQTIVGVGLKMVVQVPVPSGMDTEKF